MNCQLGMGGASGLVLLCLVRNPVGVGKQSAHHLSLFLSNSIELIVT